METSIEKAKDDYYWSDFLDYVASIGGWSAVGSVPMLTAWTFFRAGVESKKSDQDPLPEIGR